MLTLLEVLQCSNPSSTERIRAVETALGETESPFREEVGAWTQHIFPVEFLAPEAYARWRPLLADGLRFLISRLSAARLAPKIVEQATLPADTPTEIRLLRLIARMPGLQKLGQALARNRRLHPALRAELRQLENGISDVTHGEIERAIVEQLGSRVAEYRVQLDRQILSEASVSAVVGFAWTDPVTGERSRGVFKALKPHIPASFSEDMQLFRDLADFLTGADRDYGFAAHGLVEVLDEVTARLLHEIDFTREQQTLTQVFRAYGTMRGVRTPRLIAGLCSAAVTAMTEEQGIKITEAYRGKSPARRRVAEQLVEAVIAAPLLTAEGDVIFHADPHAGNLLYDVTREEVVMLDWALSERLSRDQLRHFAGLMSMLALRDASGIVKAVNALAVPPVPAIVAERVREFVRAIPLWRMAGSATAMRLLDDLALAGVRFPASLLMLRKALFTLDGVLHDLAGDAISIDAVVVGSLAWRWDVVVRLFSPADWIALQRSAALAAPRLWLSALGM